jgi:hypothetical protein
VEGYVGNKSGLYAAPGRRSSAMWLSKLEHSMRELTAECHGPQLCLPVSRGMSLVAGKENFKLFFKRGLCCEGVDCNECIVRGI